MSKIDKLLFRAIVPPFLITLTVLTSIVFLHEAAAREGPVSLSELLITRTASPQILLAMTGILLPGILIFSLPLSYLVGILIGLSGLSAENQITALRACGVPLRKLLRFILVPGAAVCLATAVFSMVLLPKTGDFLQEIKSKIGPTQATSAIQPRVFNEGFPNLVFYVKDMTPDRQLWSGIFLSRTSQTILADSGSWIADPENDRLQLHLENGATYTVDPGDPSKDSVSSFRSIDIPVNLNQKFKMERAGQAQRPKKLREQSTAALWHAWSTAAPEQKDKYLLELNYRTALPFSVFPLSLIGLTLGVGTRKGGRTLGFALSLVVVIVFYVLFLNGIRLASVGKISPWAGAWGADILFGVIGSILLIRGERNSSGRRLQLKRLPGKSQWKLPKLIAEYVRYPAAGLLRSVAGGGFFTRFRFPKVLDLYISRGFFVYFFWSLMTCGTLFVLFTLFDLLDDIIRNGTSVYVIAYFLYLTPQILMWVVPMAILLAILINFGIMEKNSEITAVKAGGWSLYRTAVPIFLIVSVLCAGLFLLQDYVLPSANRRQDNLRNIIKGRPPQTSSTFQRKWISGESNRIYNYEYFDGRQDSFVDLNIYDVDPNSVRILRRIHAARARIERSGAWFLEDGWIRDYRSDGFEQIKSAEFHFPEKAGYFETEIFQPKESSKWTYPELNDYIKYLSKSGYNATELKVELYKKISFPLSCMVMALIGVPFSFSTGKKGAFFGIGISIAVAIAYWGVSGLFESMGDYGLLLPALAAWAPNLVFGMAGLALLFTVRT